MYNPSNQYRCTIIRGKSQTDMEDLLPLYANMVHKFCPCEEEQFRVSCCQTLSKALFDTNAFDLLSKANKKTVLNHLTEIAGTLLGLYYPIYDSVSDKIFIHESESCRYIIEHNDFPTFFKNLCFNFQFPNGAKKKQNIAEDIEKRVHIKPFCYVVALLYYAQNQPQKELLTKQEIGFYVLNNLDVLRGDVPTDVVYNQIMSDRAHHVKREKLSGSKDWQHIKEQYNLLELANLIETDSTYLWLNKDESSAITYFINHKNDFIFDPYEYSLESTSSPIWKIYFEDWKKAFGRFNKELAETTYFGNSVEIASRDEQAAHSGATKSSVDLGDEGEALVFKIEQDRVRKYKERLVNKVLLLGKTKGLGYDISSIEADENPSRPEFARYIEVKSTKRITEPSFNQSWMDSVNLTTKEWVAAEQYGEYYNIYRVYFTKTKTYVVRIQNPFKKAKEGQIEVFPTIYQMNFDSSVIEKRYAK